jgi:hypothetical protein
LCVGQCFFWHLALQYLTSRHDLHALRLTKPSPSSLPHSAQLVVVIYLGRIQCCVPTSLSPVHSLHWAGRFPQPGIGGARVRSRWGAVRTITMGRDQVKRNQAARGRGRGSRLPAVPTAALMGASVSRRASRVCKPNIATPNARRIIGQRIKLHASYEPPNYATRRCSRTHHQRTNVPLLSTNAR